METEIGMISRIDRAVADNILDIQRSFGNHAGIVQDFIVFITRQLKTDLFGYTTFTLQQFCRETGRRRQELALVHPDFQSGKQAPLIEGFAFRTVFDYALYTMMEKNIIFSRKYQVKAGTQTIQMHSFPILKDLRLNFDRRDKEQKVYDVRLSDELLNGFLSRYYTINTDTYRLVGKGRGGDSRKKLLIYLSKLQHILLSSMPHPETTVPIDSLCAIADIEDPRPSHKKQSLIRILEYLRITGGFGLEYHFTAVRGTKEYHIRLIFSAPFSRARIQNEHSFYYRVLAGMREVFEQTTRKAIAASQDDPFQQWLTDPGAEPDRKAQVLMQAWYIAFNINLPEHEARTLIRSGNFTRLPGA